MALPPEAIDAFIDSNQNALARKALREAYREGGDRASYRGPEIRLSIREGRPKEAFQLIQEALRENPEDRTALWYLPQVHHSLGRLAAALEAIDELFKRHFDDAYLWALSGFVRWRQKRSLAEVREYIDAALKRDPNQTLALQTDYYLAHDRRDLERMKEIITHFTKTNPGSLATAEILSMHIAGTSPHEADLVRDLLQRFPDDPDIRQFAIVSYVHTRIPFRWIYRWPRLKNFLLDEYLRYTWADAARALAIKWGWIFGGAFLIGKLAPVLPSWVHTPILVIWVLGFLLILFQVVAEYVLEFWRSILIRFYKFRGLPKRPE